MRSIIVLGLKGVVTSSQTEMLDAKEAAVERRGWQRFAAAACFGLLTIFMYPVLAAWTLAFDENVAYWWGMFAFWWTLPMPFAFVGLWIIFYNMTKPKRGLLLGFFVIPSVVFFLIGAYLKSKSNHISDKLVSSDCSAAGQFGIRPLDLAYYDAAEKYKTCNTPEVEAALGAPILFQSCPKYKEWRKEGDNAKHWDYLQFLETTFLCSGFCKGGQESLWTREETKHDACAVVVYNVMRSKVGRLTTLLMAYPMIIIFVFLIWMHFTRPSFQMWTEHLRGQGHIPNNLLEHAKQAVQYGAVKGTEAMEALEERAKLAAQYGAERGHQAYDAMHERYDHWRAPEPAVFAPAPAPGPRPPMQAGLASPSDTQQLYSQSLTPTSQLSYRQSMATTPQAPYQPAPTGQTVPAPSMGQSMAPRPPPTDPLM